VSKGLIMKKTLLKSLLAVSFTAITGNALAVIPVTDAASIAQTANEYVTTATRWTEQVKQFETDYKNQVQQLAAQTGITDISSLISNTQDLVGNLDDIQSALSNPQAILNQGYNSLTPKLQAIYKSYGVDNVCQQTVEREQKTCQGQIIIDVLRQQRNNEAFAEVKSHYQKIQDIANRMKAAKTQKESTDYQNAIQVELAMMQADKTKLDIQRDNDIQADSLAQKQKRSEKNDIIDKDLSTITFDKSWGTN